jgi:hypothetical protein
VPPFDIALTKADAMKSTRVKQLDAKGFAPGGDATGDANG